MSTLSFDEMFGLDDLPATKPTTSPSTSKPANQLAFFVEKYAPIARAAGERLGVEPELLLGQWGLETGWGRSVISDTHNLGNIKDFSGKGPKARDNMTGSTDSYRPYESPEPFAEDFSNLIGNNKRYAAALGAGGDAKRYFAGLKQGGYAEDPAYVAKGTQAVNMVRRALGNVNPSAQTPKLTGEPASRSQQTQFAQSPMSDEELDDAFGLTRMAQPDAPMPERSFWQAGGDTALAAGQALIGLGKNITDLGGADNPASQVLDDAVKGTEKFKSDYAQRRNENSQRRIEDAQGEGVQAELKAYWDALWDAPIEMAASAAASYGPFGLIGRLAKGAQVIGLANAAKKAGVSKEVFMASPAGKLAMETITQAVNRGATAASTTLAAGLGVGGVKGQQYETTLREAKAAGKSDEEAKKLAVEAQAYGGPGTVNQVLGGALSVASVALGPVERALTKVKPAGAIATAQSAGRPFLARTGLGAFKESFPEGLQDFQQPYAGNEAAISAGVMDPSRRFEGAFGQGMQSAVLAAPMGGVAGAMEPGQIKQNKPAQPQNRPAVPPAAPPAAQTPTGEAPPAPPPAAATTAAPASPLDLGDAEIDPEMAAMADTDLAALIAGIESSDEAKVSDDDWVRYYLAKEEVKRRNSPPATAQTTAVQTTEATAPVEESAAPAGTYMPGAEVNANRVKEQPKVVLQNRDRSGAASVQQMSGIASNPDFLRIGPSTEMTTGAPVVFGNLPPTAVKGRPETVVDGKGDRIQAQYVVVDASDLIASNNADGTPVDAYVNGLPGKLRAVAGNGRTAGIQKAYQQGTAQKYRQDLIENAQTMGLDTAAIEAMQQPVLVRVMDAADVRDDMGDRTNITGTQRLSPVEQAANDARRLNLAELSFDENGNPTQETLRRFINGMPDSEKGDLIAGKEGTPTRQAAERLMAATFKQAYDSDELVELYAQAPGPEARAILNAAAEAAGALSALKEMNPDFDVREAVAGAVKMAVNAARQQKPLAEFAQNADLDTDPDAFAVARFLGQYANKPRQMANGLREWARDVLGQAEIDRTNQSQGGLFGAQPTLTRDQLFARLGNIDPNDEATIQAREALAKRDAEKPTIQEQVAEAPEATGFSLETQTPEQLQAQADERAAEEKRQRDADQAAETQAQADAELGDFTLTGSDRPADANPNQGDLLASDQPQQGDIQNYYGEPFSTKGAAQQRTKKKDARGGQVVPVQGGFVVRMPQNMSGTPSATMGTRTDAKAGPGFTAADVVRRDPIAGQKINDEWTAFAPQSGTLGIPRAEMPQVKAGDRGAMVNFLKARGIDSSKEQLPPTALKPTQAEFSPAKVQEAADRTDGDRSIIVSADGHVVDGHHQWLAQRQKGQPVNVIRLDQPIAQVLEALKEMPSAQPERIDAESAQPPSSDSEQNQAVAPAQPAAEVTQQALLDVIYYLGGDAAKNGAKSADLMELAERIDAAYSTDSFPQNIYTAVKTAAQAIRYVASTGRVSMEAASKARSLTGKNAATALAKIAQRGGVGPVQDHIDAFNGLMAETEAKPANVQEGIAQARAKRKPKTPEAPANPAQAATENVAIRSAKDEIPGESSALAAKQRWEQAKADEVQQAERDKLESDKYNAYVREQEFQAERRRLQGDRIIQQDNGKPFKKEANAQAKLDEFDLADTHAIQQVDGGFVLRQMPPSERAERKRKAEGRESYTEAQAAVVAEMGIGEDSDGELDVTDAQWDELQRRTAERMGRKLPAPESTPNQAPDRDEALLALRALGWMGGGNSGRYGLRTVQGKSGQRYRADIGNDGVAIIRPFDQNARNQDEHDVVATVDVSGMTAAAAAAAIDAATPAEWVVQPDEREPWKWVNTKPNQPPAQQTPAQAAAESVAKQPEKTQPVVARADVAAAERLAADMIRQKIDGMKAGEVQRIAARFLPTMGKKAPVGKAKIADAMTDASAFSLLSPAAELGVEFSESVKRALVAKAEGRVSESVEQPTAPTAPTIEPQRSGETDAPMAISGEDMQPDTKVGTDATAAPLPESTAQAQNQETAELEKMFDNLESKGLPGKVAKQAADSHQYSSLINQVQDQFHDLLLDLMETQRVLKINNRDRLHEDNKSCL